MKTLYFDCGMGAAGDMLAAALLELYDKPELMLERLNALSLPGVVFRRESVVRNGVSGSLFRVLIDGAEEGDPLPAHESGRRDLAGIEKFIASLALSDEVRQDVLAVFHLLAEAESRVHGRPVPQIHFHEVGTLDAIADITAVCMLIRDLSPDEILSSAVHVGHGQVRCAHGVLPVPAPATAELLKGVPIYGGRIEGELCTPTGAALLKHFVTRFCPMPEIRLEGTGYGMGKKEFEQVNCVRAFLGSRADGPDAVCILSCNLDDMSAEEIGFAAERLLAAGAKDVYTIPLGMKKNRPGTMLCVMCNTSSCEDFASLIFRYTSTLGIRRQTLGRYVLDRSETVEDTKYGSVRVKRSQGWGVRRRKIEYDDLARIARERGKSIMQIRKELEEEAER